MGGTGRTFRPVLRTETETGAVDFPSKTTGAPRPGGSSSAQMTDVTSTCDPSDESASAPPQTIVSEAEVSNCRRVLEALVSDPHQLARVSEEERHAILQAAGRLSRPTRHERQRITKAFRRYGKEVSKQEDLRLRQTVAIREAREQPRTTSLLDGGADWVNALRDRVQGAGEEEERRTLNSEQHCYICKCDYRELHFFYDSMCPKCAEFNFRKRTQTATLTGRVALVTGARIKIGFHAALLMLRAGATVIATTRFPNDAAERFARETDYEEWRDRLSVFGLDLRYCPSVERFADHILESETRLDFLLNNAAQTVHRPASFYTHLAEHERRTLGELPTEQRALLQRNHELCRALQSASSSPQALSGPLDGSSTLGGGRPLGLAAPSVFELAGLEFGHDPVNFPLGRFDADGQQLDLRDNNSWRMKAADVSTSELLEVHLVNAIAPFILVSRLKTLMQRTSAQDKHIVNVSAMEGVFARWTKTDRHPHTNMAKASLNMLTRTSASDYLKDGIHMNSVDTGWVTDEDPHRHAVRKRNDYDFSPPLDALDGAARVCDPIFTGFLTGEHAWGQFFKDYRPSNW